MRRNFVILAFVAAVGGVALPGVVVPSVAEASRRTGRAQTRPKPKGKIKVRRALRKGAAITNKDGTTSVKKGWFGRQRKLAPGGGSKPVKAEGSRFSVRSRNDGGTFVNFGPRASIKLAWNQHARGKSNQRYGGIVGALASKLPFVGRLVPRKRVTGVYQQEIKLRSNGTIATGLFGAMRGLVSYVPLVNRVTGRAPKSPARTAILRNRNGLLSWLGIGRGLLTRAQARALLNDVPGNLRRTGADLTQRFIYQVDGAMIIDAPVDEKGLEREITIIRMLNPGEKAQFTLQTRWLRRNTFVQAELGY